MKAVHLGVVFGYLWKTNSLIDFRTKVTIRSSSLIVDRN